MAKKPNKTQQKILDGLVVLNSSEAIINPFTGVRVMLEPLAVALYDYIKGCEMTGNYKNFDQARYLFMERWPSEYMQLLD